MYPRKAVVTMVLGEEWQPVAEVTLPTHRDYAERVGATFLVINQCRRPACVAYDKWQLYHVLSLFDRAVFFDADTIVRPDCPNLFLTVPPLCVGGFNELPEHPPHARHLQDFCASWGVSAPACTHYLNTGVLVLSAAHRELFAEPEVMPTHLPWPEQTHFNVRLLRGQVPTCFLSWHYNCMHLHQVGDYLRQAFVVHYSVRDLKRRRAEAERDRALWRQLAG